MPIQLLVKLDLDNLREGKSSFSFVITEVIKQSRPGFSNPVIKLDAYAPDRRLCVYTVLKVYIERTLILRGSETQLLLVLVSHIRLFLLIL